MPIYSIGQHRALTLRKLRQSSTTRYSSDKTASNYDWIDDAIECAVEEFVRLTKCLRTYAILQLKSSIRIYRLPADFIDLMAAYYYHSSLSDGYKELTITTPEKLNDEVSDWRNATGTPSRIYVDRKHGQGEVLGVYKIPDADGEDIEFDNTNASEVTWICPLYTENTDFGRVVRYASDDTFILSESDTALVDAEVSDGNILLEYYRLNYHMTEVPSESAKVVSSLAAANLLADQPEDSAEFKRSQMLSKEFYDEAQKYINRRKRSLSGQELRATPAVWNYQKSFQYHKDLP